MGGSEDGSEFQRAMRGVDPLAEGRRRVAPRRPSQLADPGAPRVEFDIERRGEHCQGLKRNAGPELLRRLERGDCSPGLSVDLHGLSKEEARRLVRASLRRALRAGLSCVRVVHGRGLRSPQGPVLKRALPGWLAEPPHGRSVLAFTTVGRYGARGGATLVLLRSGR